MKKQYLAIAILIIAAFGGFFLLKPTDTQPKAELVNPSSAKAPQTEGDVVLDINIKEDTFEPSQVTIKAGQAIRFINASTGNRWPASNIHPTHELYPEFDAKRELKPGESWTFTFREAGTWRMHDHLFPYIKGTITVE